jgi:hypothetical protein
MGLFHPRVLRRYLKHADAITAREETILREWSRSVSAGKYDSETQNDAEFIQRILIDVLGSCTAQA